MKHLGNWQRGPCERTVQKAVNADHTARTMCWKPSSCEKRHRSRVKNKHIFRTSSHICYFFCYGKREFETHTTVLTESKDGNGMPIVQKTIPNENPGAADPLFKGWIYACIQPKVRLSLSGRSVKWTSGCVIHLRGSGTYIHMPPIHRGKVRGLSLV